MNDYRDLHGRFMHGNDVNLYVNKQFYCDTYDHYRSLFHGLANIGAAKAKQSDPLTSFICDCIGFLTAKNQTEQLCSFASMLDTMLNG